MTRSRSLSLSLALHGAVLLGLAWVGFGPPPDETPAGITVVWLDTGLPDLAAASRGDAGMAEDGKPDSDAEPLPDPLVAADAEDQPAPPHPDARDPVSGADRPAPPPTESADDELGQRAARAPPAPGEERPEPSRAAEPLQASARASSETSAPPRDASAETPPEPLDASAATHRMSAEPPAEPVPPTEQAMLLAELMDLVHRSRDLPSRPSIAWSRKGQEYRAELKRVISAGATGIDEAVIEVTTERDGRQVSTELRMKRLAFSHYAQFIDRWDPNVQIHDDEIDGRFHSNSDIVIANSGGIQPVFRGKVTTTGNIDTSRSDRRVRRHQVFLGGVETRTPRIALPRRFAPLEALAADAGNVVALERDSRITFFADGTYEIEPVGGRRCGGPGGTRLRAALGASPTYFVAAEKCTVAVKGTVNGKVLVYSPVEIVIEGDLVYADDPRRKAQSDDYLGLVSDGTVEVADPDVTGPGDLTVQAAIYAKRLFAVRRYTRGGRATLTLYGSLTAGSLTATEPRYRTKLEFDPRLEHARPPSFPMTDRYELASWDGMWRPVGEQGRRERL